MIEAIELTSTRRPRGPGRADGGPVENVSFDVYPGQVTALLGASGTGKSTVLRLMVELEAGGGRTLFGGRPYRALRPAAREVGLALNPDAVHPGRTVQAHLHLYSAGGGVPKARVAEVLEVVGLSTQATVRCGRLDPGQRQRLAIAAALLGDPAALIMDEPRALDGHGMSWFHALIRAYAAQGRTVLVAATDPDTLSGTADHVIVLRRDEHDGVSRVIASRSAAEVFDERRATVVQVRSPQAARLAAALESEGAALAPAGPGALQVRGLDRARIGEIAHATSICLHELSEIGHDDDVFGLRPVPRQKELLPGLHRTPAWRAGVRVVAEEIEEAEVVEAQMPAAGAREDLVGAQAGGADGAGGRRAEGSTVRARESVAADASLSARVLATGGREELLGAQAGVAYGAGGRLAESSTGARESVVADASLSARVLATGGRGDLVGAQAGADDGAGGQAAESSIAGARHSVLTDSAPPSEGPAAEAGQVSQGIGVWPSQGSVAEPREWAASDPARGEPVVGAESQAAADGAGVWPSQGSTAEPRESASRETTEAPDLSATHVTETTPGTGSWRTQGSAANARWWAAQVGPESPRRGSTFGLRRTRSKPTESQPPAVPTQPAVPFTVAARAVEPAAESAGDGMTPWRAVAARASQGQQATDQQNHSRQPHRRRPPSEQPHTQQQPPVAEAAPAEQDASA